MIPLGVLLLLVPASLPQRVALPQTERPSTTAPFTVLGRSTNAGSPLVEVGLAVELRLDDEVLSSVDVLTDADGRFAASLPQRPERYADDPWLRRRLRVRVRAYEPGFMRYVWEEPVPTGSNVVALRELLWTPGGTLTLHVVDRDGAPVPSSEVVIERLASPQVAPPEAPGTATLTLRCPAGPRPGNRQPVVARPHTNALDVHLAASEHANLLLRSSGRGTAYLPDVTLPSGSGDGERTVRLQGSGRLSGTLRDPDGNPLADVPLTAVPFELVDREAPARRLGELIAERETAGGLVTDTCTTDATGRFELDGLLPGTYFMMRTGGDETVGTIPRQAIPTGSFASLATLRRTDRPAALSIRVVAPSRTSTAGRTATRRLTKEPQAFTISQCLVGLERKQLAAGDERTCGWSVVPGDRYAAAWIGDHHVVEREVVIDPAAPTTPVELVLEEPLPAAGLTVELRDPSGASLQLDPFELPSVELRSPLSGMTFFSRPCDGLVASLEVAPRTYVLALSSSLTREARRQGLAPRSWHGAAPVTLELLPGERRHVVLSTFVGGRVRLEVDVPWTEGTVDETPAVVTDARDGSELAFYTREDERDWRTGVVPRTTAVSHSVLAPGSHVLLVEAPGFEPETVRIDIRPREIVDARVELRRLR